MYLAPIPEEGEHCIRYGSPLVGSGEDWIKAPELGMLAKVFNQDLRNLPHVYAGMKTTAREHLRLGDYNELLHFHKLYSEWVGKTDSGYRSVGRPALRIALQTVETTGSSIYACACRYSRRTSSSVNTPITQPKPTTPGSGNNVIDSRLTLQKPAWQLHRACPLAPRDRRRRAIKQPYVTTQR